MNKILEDMFKEFEFNEKPEAIIREVNGIKLPEDYLSFMSEHNGGEGPLGENNYGRFYMLEELAEINDDYDVQNSWPGYVVIGGIDDALWAYNPDKKISTLSLSSQRKVIAGSESTWLGILTPVQGKYLTV